MGVVELDPEAVGAAVRALADGGTILLLDSDGGPGSLGMAVMAAACADADRLLTFANRTTGWQYLALTDLRCEELGLALVAERDDMLEHAPLTVTIKARQGVTTGVSMTERARTIRVAIDPSCGRDDIRYGGNIMPLRAQPGGVLERAGYTEAATDLARLAGLTPAAVLGAMINSDGSQTVGEDLVAFGRRDGLPIVTIGDVIAHRHRSEQLVRQVASTPLATRSGDYTVYGYVRAPADTEHVAFVRGDLAGDDVPVYLHKACWEGDVFRSRLCDCRARLDAAIAAIAKVGRGVIVHFTRPDYFHHGTRPADAEIRDIGVGAQILSDLGLSRIKLLTDEPRPLVGLGGYGLTVVGYEPLLGWSSSVAESNSSADAV